MLSSMHINTDLVRSFVAFGPAPVPLHLIIQIKYILESKQTNLGYLFSIITYCLVTISYGKLKGIDFVDYNKWL